MATVIVEEVWMTSFKHSSSNAWITDSGASRHMISDGFLFIIKQAVSRIQVAVGDGVKLFAKSLGNIAFSLDDNIVKMTDVLHVSGLDANLLSVSVLNRKGLNVLFKNGGIQIRKDEVLVAAGVLREKLYFLHSAQMTLHAGEFAEGGAAIAFKVSKLAAGGEVVMSLEAE